jgi:hypothetical protein
MNDTNVRILLRGTDFGVTPRAEHFAVFSDEQLPKAHQLMQDIYNNKEVSEFLPKIIESRAAAPGLPDVSVYQSNDSLLSFIKELVGRGVTIGDLQKLVEESKGEPIDKAKALEKLMLQHMPTGAPPAPPPPISERIAEVVENHLTHAQQGVPEGQPPPLPPRPVGYKAPTVVFTPASDPRGQYDVIPGPMAAAGRLRQEEAAAAPVPPASEGPPPAPSVFVAPTMAKVTAPYEHPPAPPSPPPGGRIVEGPGAELFEEPKKASLWKSIKNAGVAFKERIGLADKINREHEDYKSLKKMEGDLEGFAILYHFNGGKRPKMTAKQYELIHSHLCRLIEINERRAQNKLTDDPRTQMIGTRAQRWIDFIQKDLRITQQSPEQLQEKKFDIYMKGINRCLPQFNANGMYSIESAQQQWPKISSSNYKELKAIRDEMVDTLQKCQSGEIPVSEDFMIKLRDLITYRLNPIVDGLAGSVKKSRFPF